VLDAHFAHSMQAVTSWCKEKNNCVTPTQLVTALQSRYRLRNTIVHLVEHNRSQLDQVESILGKMTDQLKKTVKRCNDVFFQLFGVGKLYGRGNDYP
jgi:K+/H+ antiporter YhaU regulatory subunit KhtT